MSREKEVTWDTDRYHYIHEREKGKTEIVRMDDEQAQVLVDLGHISVKGMKKSTDASTATTTSGSRSRPSRSKKSPSAADTPAETTESAE